ncbi:MAG: response regulator [Victivallales bacterium]|nr:response regulator [Victivallales bacterium]
MVTAQDGIRMLVFEDDPEDALLLRRMLGDLAVDMVIAASLAEGLAHLQAAHTDVILLDLSLPDARGMEGLHGLEEAGIDLPVVIMTGLDDEATALEAVQHGAQDYLVKGKAGAAEVCRAMRYAMERHRLQQELLEARGRAEQLRADRLEALGVLAGGIAHDFNNLLTGIMGNISLAKDASPGEIKELLAEAERASSRATSLTRQLLTFAKGGAPITEPTALAGMIREAVSFGLRGSNVGAEYSLSDDLWPVDIDSGQVARAFQNIVINADQAMPQGGSIQVRARNVEDGADLPSSLPDGNMVEISFADSGQGIPPQSLSRIFDPYFTTKQKGSGLGLAAAFSIIQKHGGTITVDSELGEGTTFTFYLPACKATPASGAAAQDQSHFCGGKILVMDDEEPIRKLAQRYLEGLGFEVAVACSGDDALVLYRDAMEGQQPFSAVIADLTVPGGMGGCELIQQLRAMDPGTVAIASSGYSQDPVMDDPGAHGFCDVMPKPYRMAELGALLVRVLPDQVSPRYSANRG